MSDSQSPQADASLFSKVLQEPIVHFFVIAVLIFGLYALTQSDTENLLEVQQRDIDARIFLAEMSSGEELSSEQRQLLTARYIEEQILVREALAMELDKDARIDDILAQKMRHVLSGEIIQPSKEELDNFYQQNQDKYRSSATVTVDELVFDSAGELSQKLMGLLLQSSDPQILLSIEPGNVSTLPGVNHTDLNNIFEEAYANEVFNAEINVWTGPFVSNRGQHWLRVTARSPSALPELDEITDLVRLDWIGTEEDSRLQQEIDLLWDKYSIVITDSETR